jgi:hypothetical protein
MALVNSNYEFIFIDVGTNGRVSDGGVWGKCSMKQAIEKNDVSIPRPRKLPNSSVVAPFVVVADDAFGMKPYLMKPYKPLSTATLSKQQRVFNYRLSRARRVVENAFGILCNRWRFLLGTIIMSTPENVENPVLAACALHNYLSRRKPARAIYIPDNLIDREGENGEIIPGAWRQDYPSATYPRPNFGGHRTSADAKEVQTLFKDYFNNEGSVPWQDDRL